jgi:ABC-type hemin transport system ATPase subunit
MEYDESIIVTRLIADAMLNVRDEHPNVSYQQTCLLAALHLIRDIAFSSEFEYRIRDTSAELLELLRLDRSEEVRLREGLEHRLRQLRQDRGISYKVDQKIKTATYLIDSYICGNFEIPTSHPVVVAALVGSIQSTTKTPIFEVSPITAELSLGKIRHTDNNSFPMGQPGSKTLGKLISLKLLINEIHPLFTEFSANITATHTPSYLIDTCLDLTRPDSFSLNQSLEFISSHREPARFMLVLPDDKTYQNHLNKMSRSDMLAAIRLDAVICFSSVEIKGNWKDRLLIILSRGVRRFNDTTLYVDVSDTNKSLKTLDLQERAILAAHIFNTHEGRSFGSHLKHTPSKVATILNAQFHEGYRNVKTLCSTHTPDRVHSIKIHSPKSFIRTHKLDGETFNNAADPQKIIDLLSDSNRPACIYVIGDNGAGKTLILCELIEQMSTLQRKTVGISTGVHDRFPFGQVAQKLGFEYKGVRTRVQSISPSQLTKSIVTLAAKVFVDQQKLDALTECQTCLGYIARYYLTLKPEMALEETPTEIRFMQMSPSASDNRIPDRLEEYEFGLVRPQNEGQSQRIISYSSLSSGEQNINQLLLSIITSAEPGKVFLVDEPEISLHLQWQQTLPRVFHLLSKRFGCSFVVATHAPTLISNANDEHSHSFLLGMGLLRELSEKDRYSVESIILGGFGTYTPHNRGVHEACARLVARTMGAKTNPRDDDRDPLLDLEKIKSAMQKEPGAYIPPGQQEDLDLINKAYVAIEMLLREQRTADEQTDEVVEADNND